MHGLDNIQAHNKISLTYFFKFFFRIWLHQMISLTDVFIKVTITSSSAFNIMTAMSIHVLQTTILINGLHGKRLICRKLYHTAICKIKNKANEKNIPPPKRQP